MSSFIIGSRRYRALCCRDRRVLGAVRIATRFHHRPDDGPIQGDRRVCSHATNVPERRLHERTRQFQMRVQPRLRLRRRSPPVHR